MPKAIPKCTVKCIIASFIAESSGFEPLDQFPDREFSKLLV